MDATAHAHLTPLAAMVLALLREDDMHPYEMIRLMRQRRDDRMVKVTGGTLYHTVARLQRRHLIAQAGIDRAGNRPERTTYSLTHAGERMLADWVRSHLPCVDSGPEFRVALAEAHNLERAEVQDLLARRRTALAEELVALEAGCAAAVDHRVAAQFLVEVDRNVALLRADIDWTDGLLAKLADPGYHWGAAELPDEYANYYQDRREAARR